MACPLLEEVAINPPYLRQNFYRTGKQALGGLKQNLVCPRIQEKGVVTPQETDPDLSVSVSKSLWLRCGLAMACYRVGGTECSSACMGLLKEVIFIIFITSTMVWPQVK